MDEIAIRVEGLGKRFRLRHQNGGPRYRTLREELLSAPRQLLARLRQRRSAQEEFWALKDVSFEVKRGEVLGIIGRNGAGKSTLLKILSRIMDPTTGEATVYGRIGSLLEVGTGFHPELTGRENIYLSGALLGMKRDEVRRRFDEIVEFAGVEKFIDTACKHYSSGMYTRLGFAVAAHLDTEILLVDEVLAVGDAEFQRRCITRMGDMADEGRTVLLVSHDLNAIRRLTVLAFWIDDGRIAMSGPSPEVIDRYVCASSGGGTSAIRANFEGNGRDFSFRNAELLPAGGGTVVALGGAFDVVFEIEAKRCSLVRALCLAVGIRSELGAPVTLAVDKDSGFVLDSWVGPRCQIKVSFSGLMLYPGRYHISLWAGSPDGIEAYDHRQDCLSFEVADIENMACRRLPQSQGLWFMRPTWRLERPHDPFNTYGAGD